VEPDRTTPLGGVINSYLTHSTELDDRSIHLLFSANRWERSFVPSFITRTVLSQLTMETNGRKEILKDLEEGTTVVCDRYAFSGIAFSTVKVNAFLAPSLPTQILIQAMIQGLSYEWCQSPDVGLPSPDLVIFLSLSPSLASLRGGFGNERYETSSIQQRVREVFGRIEGDFRGRGGRWSEVDAGGGVEEVGEEVWREVEKCKREVGEGTEVGTLWV